MLLVVDGANNGCVDRFPIRSSVQRLLVALSSDRIAEARFEPHTVEDLTRVAAEINQRPRKTLGWQRPADLFDAAIAAC